jgi:protein-tyrosine phosphatase
MTPSDRYPDPRARDLQFDRRARGAYLSANAVMLTFAGAVACAAGTLVFLHEGRPVAATFEVGAALVWAWATVALALFCAGFLGGQRLAFARSAQGRIPLWRATLLAPVLVGAAAWNDVRRKGHSPCDEIVPGLWLGDIRAAVQPWSLVLDMTCEYTRPSTTASAYACLAWMDGTIVDAPTLEAAAELIDKALKEAGARVLVHCALGRWRSAQVVAYWLQTRRGQSEQAAWTRLKTRRACVKAPRYVQL